MKRVAEPELLVLRIDPKDRDALQTKLFLLSQTEQYAQALALIGDVNKQNDQDKEAFLFERAYTLHRLHQEGGATEVLKALKDRDDEEGNRGVTHLEAQLVRGIYLVYTCYVPDLVCRRRIVKATIRQPTTCTTRSSTQLNR